MNIRGLVDEILEMEVRLKKRVLSSGRLSTAQQSFSLKISKANAQMEWLRFWNLEDVIKMLKYWQKNLRVKD